MLHDISKNVTLAFIGRFLGNIIAIISLGFITRALGTGSFGEYTTVIAYLAIFQLVSDFGLHTLLTREISQNPHNEQEIVSKFFTLRLCIVFVVLLFGCALVFAFPYSSVVKIGVVMSGIAFLAMSLTQMLLGVFQKHFQVYKSTTAELLGRIVNLVLVIIFFYTHAGVLYFLLAFIVATLVMLCANLLFTQSLVKFRVIFPIPGWKQTLKTAIPVAVSIIFTLLYFRADTIILSIMKDAEAVGLYGAAYKVLEAFLFFPAAFFGILMPILSRQAKNSKKLGKTVSFLFNSSVFVVAPLVAGGVLVSATILNVVGGEQFVQSTTTLQILFGAIGVIVFGNLFGNTVIALDIQKKAMIAYIAGFVFNVVANILVIPTYSYTGAAATTLLTEILVTIVLFVVVRKAIKITVSLYALVLTVLSTTAMTLLILFIVPNTTQVLSIPTFLLVIATGAGFYIAINAINIKAYIQKARSVFK